LNTVDARTPIVILVILTNTPRESLSQKNVSIWSTRWFFHLYEDLLSKSGICSIKETEAWQLQFRMPLQ